MSRKSATIEPIALDAPWRLRVVVKGAVQGVGYRPFVYRLAKDLDLTGWVNNTSQGVFIEVEGPWSLLEIFLRRIELERPPRAEVRTVEVRWLGLAGYKTFEILESEDSGAKTAQILPDIAPCADCLREIFDPDNRRYQYPFTNCTNCGPRFSIVEAIPYDRAHTTMRAFRMCERCRREYEDPFDRRFHAQPNACPDCGPCLELWSSARDVLARREEALGRAAEAVERGKILALKGLGGFQLIVDARNDGAVAELRRRKRREEKPFALMFPDLACVEAECLVSQNEKTLLLSPEAPIVLLQRRAPASSISERVAPRNPWLGVMLPATPLHHLLVKKWKFPVVATSGNLSQEPLCTEENEALARLAGVADLFLVHDRPIARPMDDSVVRAVLGGTMCLRRARGYAPRPLEIKAARSVLAVGGHLKNTVAVTVGGNAILSQHVGDLETRPAHRTFRRAAEDLRRLYAVSPERVAADMHPDYLSTQYARGSGLPVELVQHHHAHMASCMAENGLEGDVLGVVWDGSGYGPDGTVWGGEFLVGDQASFDRYAHFRSFRLPGGEKAVKEPRRAAIGLLYEIFGSAVFEMKELAPVEALAPREKLIFHRMLDHGLHSPETSSAGRLFDAAASLLDLRQRTSFEGQAAMELEFEAWKIDTEEAYPIGILDHRRPLSVDWEPMVRGLLQDRKHAVPVPMISAKFHNTLADVILMVAGRAGKNRVVLSGGCFQNVYLLRRAVARLRDHGFEPYFHRQVPPNDGGLALGQAAVALARRGED